MSSNSPGPAVSYRLPRTVLPHRYDLTLTPDLETASFTGTVAIGIDLLEAASEIVLNAVELSIDEVWIERDGDRLEGIPSLDSEAERLAVGLDGELASGPATLHVVFAGILNDKLRGFYRSTFDDDEGVSHTIATTQFEATDARRAFPCWDEPDLKATFALTLDVPDGLSAVSNAAEVSSQPSEGGGRRVRFADTMVMSTYLVAVVVGPLVATEPVDVEGVPLRVVHRAGQEELAAFALESGAFALRYFAEYFGRPYPADKLDLVAVPDFAFGAMENLGCVTFRDVLLLVDPARSTQAELQRVADVIHHEIAHMWFGDLVTMRWWNGIWLNEAFATFMEMRCTDAFRPEWDRWTDFGAARTGAFDTDALSSTRPIEFEVVSPAEAEGMFDVLTYEKGAAVVRMLEQYLGEDRFRDGIRLYIERHAFANTETTDLWDALEEATGEPVRRIMDGWIFQGGYPEVSVTRDDGSATVRLDQRRFRYASNGDTGASHDDEQRPSDDEARWAVPVLIRSSSAGSSDDGSGGADDVASALRLHKVLLEGATTEVDLGGPATWVLANSGGSGFFRVRYAPDDLRALAGAGADLTALERFGLLDDAWAGLLAATMPVDALLDLVRARADETDLNVWQRVLAVLAGLGRLIDDAARPDLEGWVRALVGPALRRVGPDPIDGEPTRTAALRGALLTALGTSGADPEARQRAVAVLDRLETGATVDPDLLDAAVRVVASIGDAGTYERFREQSSREATPQGRLRYLGALADFPAPAEVDAFLASTLTDEVRAQDTGLLLRRALTNRSQGERAWRFVADRWDGVGAKIPSNTVSRMLEGIRTVTDPALAADIGAFLDAHPVPQGAKAVAQHRERMGTAVALRARVEAPLAAALR